MSVEERCLSLSKPTRLRSARVCLTTEHTEDTETMLQINLCVLCVLCGELLNMAGTEPRWLGARFPSYRLPLNTRSPVGPGLPPAGSMVTPKLWKLSRGSSDSITIAP